MKLAHLADLHLGFRQYGRQTPQGINQREADIAQAFRRVVDDVIDVAPDIVLVAGDLFHSVRPTNVAILDSFNQFRRLREALPSTPVVLIAGNHDTPRSVETGSILRLFEAIGDVYTVRHEPRCITFDSLDLAVTAAPHAAFLPAPGAVKLHPNSEVKWNVRLQHFPIAGMVPDRAEATYHAVELEPGDLQAEQWDYVALGHYHVAQQVRPNAWFSGSVEFVSPNPWAELREGSPQVPHGAKGWLLVTLMDDGPNVEFRPVALARSYIDLTPIHATGMSATEIDEQIASRVAGVKGGIDNQVVRQVVYDVPRTVARDLDHAVIRNLKSRALHYRFDVRRPAPVKLMGIDDTGVRKTLAELVREYLSNRPLPAGMERNALLALGKEYLEEA